MEEGTGMTSADTTPQERARKRAKDYTGMLWHIATFLIINGFFWVLDAMQGGGINWAYWITIFWGIGLAFHIAWYFIDVSGEGRRYAKFLEDEERKGTA
jgi:hypothetical protein